MIMSLYDPIDDFNSSAAQALQEGLKLVLPVKDRCLTEASTQSADEGARAE